VLTLALSISFAMKNIPVVLALCLVTFHLGAQSLISYVNPFIGTGGHGHTYPGAAAPFGFMQLSPDSRIDGWDGCGGYHYSDSILYGFSHTHLSGTGVSDYADLLIMPFDPTLVKKDAGGRIISAFSHKNEKAEPGFYSVGLNDYKIKAALTVTERAGIHQYQFGHKKAHMVIDLDYRDRLLDYGFEIIDNRTIRGKRISDAWATEQHFYFYIQFSDHFKVDSMTFEKKRLYLNFGNRSDIEARVGISAVDMAGAQRNLEQEIGNRSFEEIKKQTQAAWEKELNRIQIFTSNKDFLTIYYTALYHSFLNPNVFSDVDGRYRGMDLKIHQLQNDRQYTVFSLWDTFRALHPLLTIVHQNRTEEMVRTMLRQYLQGGKLPMWELCANETSCMIAYHSVPVIVDAFMKGLRDFDHELALKAMLGRAFQEELGIPALIKFGFLPVEIEHESVSKTLEYAYNDWCIAIFAQALGKTDIAKLFFERAQYYKNLYNPKHGFMQAKLFNTFQEPFDPREVNFNFTEGNSWQYSFFVPQDISGMIALYGGREKFIAKLDELFTAPMETTGRHQVDITGLIGQYAHGNEPSHHMAFLYNYVGQPHKTQAMTRRIIEEMYTIHPDGLSGNEDCGQMSAWLNLTALGFYSVTPGSTQYAITAPFVDSAFINLENGRRFVIVANNLSSENIYIQSIKLNGKTHDKLYIEHQDIIKGGRLEFEMGSNPSDFGSKNPPKSIIENQPFSIVPYFDSQKRTFTDSLCISIGKVDAEQLIYYTLDGSEPSNNSTLYTEAICLKTNTKIRAIAYSNGVPSKVVETEYFKIPANWNITIHSKYSKHYSAGGPRALIDFQRGGQDFRTGAWQGYQGQNFSATVDLGKVERITKVGGNFIQEIRSWIWLPKNLTIYVSTNGKKWKKVAFITHNVSTESYETVVLEMAQKIKPTKARYVKFEAEYYGKIPTWHLGAGGESYIFIDELIIE
jgi:predicted alpha-1,2-mannosidase